MEKLLPNATKLVVEFLYTPRAIYKPFLTRVGRMRIRGYVLYDYLVFNSVDSFSLLGSDRGAVEVGFKFGGVVLENLGPWAKILGRVW